LGFNSTFGRKKATSCLQKYVAVKNIEINEKVENVTCWEYASNIKPLQ